MKGGVIPMWMLFRHANWNRATGYWLGQIRTKNGATNSSYLCLFLMIQFLSRLCNIFFSQINSAEGVLPNDKFWKQFILPFLKYPLKCKFDGQTLTKCDFLEDRLPKYFFRKYVFSGGKQTMHKVSAAFIVKNCYPRTSLNNYHARFRWTKATNAKKRTALRRK